MRSARIRTGWIAAVVWFGVVLFAGERLNAVVGGGAFCPACLKPFALEVYIVTDQITDEKVEVCPACARGDRCFMCGIPVSTNVPGYTALSDERFLCARDGKTAVIEDSAGKAVCEQVKNDLHRRFSRFMETPADIEITLVDRPTLVELFKFPGRDFDCPNAWGFFQSETNGTAVTRSVSILGGLPLSFFRATCAHEYTHAWMHQAVPEARLKALHKDAKEGFCELVSYLLMRAEGDAFQQKQILRNGYTRGHIDLFIEAERQYGIQEIIDWLVAGTDTRLRAGELYRLRHVETPTKPAVASKATTTTATGQPAVLYVPPPPVVGQETLNLQGIVWNRKQPLAMVNGQTLAAGESASVLLGTNRIRIQCVTISSNYARVRRQDTGEESDLRLKSR